MSTHDASNSLPQPEGFREDEIVVELPSTPGMVVQERMPSGDVPMEEIYLRGRAYRGLSGGTAPAWVLVMGWVMFGAPALFCVGVALATGDVAMLLPVMFLSVFLVILWRGTRRKMSRRRRRV